LFRSRRSRSRNRIRNAPDVFDEFAQAIVFGEVDRFEAHLLGMGEPFLVHVSDQHGCHTKKVRGPCGREADRPAPATWAVDLNADRGGDGSVKFRRQDIERQVRSRIFLSPAPVTALRH